MFILSSKSQLKLSEVHSDLQKVVEAAIKITPIDFAVIEGMRTLERQKALLAAGATKTLKSRHLDGHAVDLACIVDGTISWKPALYTPLSEAVLKAAKELNIPVVWGGSWKSFPDLDHFELDRNVYPSKEA